MGFGPIGIEVGTTQQPRRTGVQGAGDLENKAQGRPLDSPFNGADVSGLVVAQLGQLFQGQLLLFLAPLTNVGADAGSYPLAQCQSHGLSLLWGRSAAPSASSRLDIAHFTDWYLLCQAKN